ncbi:MAG: ABC transporter permease [Blastocatellia bacterium]
MLKNYIKIAYKVFLRRKFFTFISLFAISFTLIVLMVATAYFDYAFGSMPPESKLGRTLGVYRMQMSGERGRRNGLVGYGFLDRYCRNLPHVEKTSFFTMPASVTTYDKGEKIKLFFKRTDGEFWQIMDFSFLEGAPFTAEDDKNRNFVAVINDATRQKFFGTEPGLGKSIAIDGQSFRIVGVVKNVPALRVHSFSDVWAPISTYKSDSYKKEYVAEFMALFLAGSKNDFPAIQEEFDTRLANAEIPDKEFNQLTSRAETFLEGITSEAGGPSGFMMIVIVAALLFMLLPTINLININVSRIMERASEVGVRKAFGASSLTLVGQFVIENVLLSLVGGAIGFVGSFLVLQAIARSGVIPYAEFHFNYRIFLYGFGTAVFFGLFSGVYPAWKMSRLHPVQALQGGTR